MLDVFQAIEATRLALVIKESTWAFAVIESIHLLALALMGGMVLLVDLRVLGIGLTNRPARELVGETKTYMTVALVVLLVTGVGLFLSEAVKCYYSTPFWVKMTALAVAILFTYTVRQRVVRNAPDHAGGGAMVVSLCSLALWFTVAASGRWIGFSG